MLLMATYWRSFAACLSAPAVYSSARSPKTLRGDGVVDATGETAACSALSLTPQWWSVSRSSPTSDATVTWSDSSSLSARNSQASAADRSFLRWRLSCVACVIFSLAFARHSAAVVILGSDLSLPEFRGGSGTHLVKTAHYAIYLSLFAMSCRCLGTQVEVVGWFLTRSRDLCHATEGHHGRGEGCG